MAAQITVHTPRLSMTTYPFQNTIGAGDALSSIAVIEASETALAIRLIASEARGHLIARMTMMAMAGAKTVASASGPIAFISPPTA